MIKALLALLAGAVFFLPAAAQAQSTDATTYQALWLNARVSLSGTGAVGQVLSLHGAPVGGSCQMFRNGTAISGATSCTSYTIQSADAGTTLTFAAFTPGLAVSGSTGSQLNFSQSANSGLLALF